MPAIWGMSGDSPVCIGSFSGGGGGGAGPWALLAHTAIAQVTSGTTGAIDTTGATILVAAVAWYNGGSTPSVSDSKGNTWHALTARAGGNGSVTLFYSFPTVVGSGHTCTIGGGASFASLAVAAFSGGGSTVDAESGAGSASTSTQQPGSVSPAGNNELFVTGLCLGDATSGTATVDSSFVITDVLIDGTGTDFDVGLAYLNQAAAAAKNPTWTRSGSSAGRMAAALAAFQP